MNYIKSELYRSFHSKTIYALAGTCAALLLAMNLILYLNGTAEAAFPYNNTAFAFVMVQSCMGVVFFLTPFLANTLFADEYKNRTLTNSVAYGYSRISLFLGKVIAGLIVSVILLVVVLGIFIGSSFLLLQNSGMEYLWQLLETVGVCIPILLAGELAAYMFSFVLGKGSVWAWLGVIVFVPTILSLLGMKFEICAKISSWTIYEILHNGLHMSADGYGKTMLAGGIGSVIFLVIGIFGVRKKELK